MKYTIVGDSKKKCYVTNVIRDGANALAPLKEKSVNVHTSAINTNEEKNNSFRFDIKSYIN